MEVIVPIVIVGAAAGVIYYYTNQPKVVDLRDFLKPDDPLTKPLNTKRTTGSIAPTTMTADDRKNLLNAARKGDVGAFGALLKLKGNKPDILAWDKADQNEKIQILKRSARINKGK